MPLHLPIQDPNLAYDYLDGDPDPLPNFFDTHGTSVAGEIGMRKSNIYCGAGIAYSSTITGNTKPML